MAVLGPWWVGNRDPSITETITAGGAAVDLNSPASTVRFKARDLNSDTLLVDQPATIVQTGSGGSAVNKGAVRYDWQAADIAANGILAAARHALVWWEVTVSGKTQDMNEAVIEVREHGVASEPAYVELEQLKETLSLTGTQYADWDLQVAAKAASRTIDAMCGRRFYPDPDANQVRIYTPWANGLLYVDDLLTLTTLRTDPGGDGTYEETWAPTDYVLEPVNAPLAGRPYELILMHGLGRYPFPSAYAKGVQVTAKFGWARVPDAIVEATAILTGRLVKRKREAPYGVVAVGGLESGSGKYLPRLDPDVRSLVAPYTRKLMLL